MCQDLHTDPQFLGVEINGQALKNLRGFVPRLRAVLLHDGVFDLGIVYVCHVQRRVFLGGSHQKVFHWNWWNWGQCANLDNLLHAYFYEL